MTEQSKAHDLSRLKLPKVLII